VKKIYSFLITFIISFSIFATIFAGSVYLGYLYITPSKYVTLDCAHTVEFSINIFDRVIKINSDDENKEIINNLKLKNTDISEAVHEAVYVLKSEGYIADDSCLVISLSNKEENAKLDSMKKLQEKIKVNLNENYDVQMVKIHPITN
jgi:hypothetical protein